MIYPATYNIIALRNATFRLQFTAKDESGTAINLNGYVIDADIYDPALMSNVASFTCTATNAAAGQFKIELEPPATLGLNPGTYNYDVSLTQPGGDRYYWVKGTLTVQQTVSRN